MKLNSFRPNMDPSYKVRKEAFVSNLSGSSILDINAASFVAPVSFKLRPATQAWLTSVIRLRRRFFSGPPSNRDSPSSHHTVLLHC